jgi:hypothetical protein
VSLRSGRTFSWCSAASDSRSERSSRSRSCSRSLRRHKRISALLSRPAVSVQRYFCFLFALSVQAADAFLRATAFMQYRRPLGAGPSGKTWPRWASHVLQMVSIRCRKLGPSKRYAMTFAYMGCAKVGHPVPDSNFSGASNRTVPQQRQEYITGSNRLHICELKGRSVPASRVTWYSSGLNCLRHSASVFSTLRSGAGLPSLPRDHQ